MNRVRQLMIVCLSVLISTAAVAQAPADEGQTAAKDAAIAKFKEGITAFDAKDFESALEYFTAAYELNPSWKLLYNIAHCNAALKKNGVALDAFEKYLSAGGDEIAPERRDEVLGELDRIRKIVGDLEINAPDGLTVFVDGHNWGTTPLPGTVPVPSGSVLLIELKRADQVVFTVNKSVRGGATAVVTYTERDETTLTTSEPEPAQPAAVAVPAAAPVDSGRKKISPVPFWVCAGLTVALGAGTLVMNGIVASNNDTVETPEDKDTLETQQTVGIVFFAGTLTAAVATGVLAIFTDFKGERKKDGVSVGFYGSDHDGGMILTGRF